MDVLYRVTGSQRFVKNGDDIEFHSPMGQQVISPFQVLALVDALIDAQATLAQGWNETLKSLDTRMAIAAWRSRNEP